MRTLIKSGIAAALLLAFAVPVTAQAPGIDIRLNPRIGVYQPLTDLVDIQAAGTRFVAEQSGSLAIGLGAEFDIVLLPVNFRLNLDYATGSEVTWTEDGIETAPAIETNLLAVSADVLFRPLPRMVVLQPYFFGGAGLMQYNVDGSTTVESFESESDFALHLGGGLDLGLGPFGFNAELGDYVSWYSLGEEFDSEMQHDLFVTVGFSIGLL